MGCAAAEKGYMQRRATRDVRAGRQGPLWSGITLPTSSFPYTSACRAIASNCDRPLTLSSLDLSFNNVRHAPRLDSQTRLRVLYLVQNKISAIEAGDLDWAAGSMTSLELGGNRLRVIQNLEKLVRLEEIWLGKNKIRTLEVGAGGGQQECG
jgi:hypothetical protein